MATIIIERETFQPVGDEIITKHGKYEFRHQMGTVSVKIGQKQVTAQARRDEKGDISVSGFVGRYRTSPNPWRASVVTRGADDAIYANFGRDDRSLRFRKIDCISWEPDTYDSINKR